MLLIEAVVVLTIVAALTAVVLLAAGSAQRKSRDVDRITDMNAVRKALLIFMDDRGYFPQGDGVSLGSAAARSLCGDGWSYSCEGRPYMLHVPGGRGKISGKCGAGQDDYVYSQTDEGRGFGIVFCFEGQIGDYGGGLRKADQYGIR